MPWLLNTWVVLRTAVVGVSLAVICGITGVAIAAPDPGANNIIPILPVNQWQVQCDPNDKVNISEKEGCLWIDYDVDIQKLTQVGNLTFKEARFRCALKNSRPLNADETRILFEANGIVLNANNGAATVTVCPFIIDQTGENLFYMPVPDTQQVKSGPQGWGRWMSNYFYASEAGGAASNIFDSRGGDGNSWPDGKLQFGGFEVRVRSDAFGRQHGALQIASVETAGLRLPAEPPFIYADALLKDKGSYTVAVEVEDRFQGVPVQELSRTIVYDPAGLQSGRQRISFPTGGAKNYWINYQITDASGNSVAGDHLRYDQTPSAEPSTVATTADVRTPPALGYLRINPEQHTEGVYERDEPGVVNVRVFPRRRDELTLSWRLRPFAYDTTIAEGKQIVQFAGQPFRDIPVTVPWQTDQDAYRLLFEVHSGDLTLDREQYVLGRETDLTHPRTTRIGQLVDRQKIKQSAYFHVTYARNEVQAFKSEDEAVADFEAFADQASQITPHLTYMVPLEQFLILPGVYDMALLDRLMDAATDHGCTLKIRFGVNYQPGRGEGFTYLPYSRQCNFDGRPILADIYGGGFSLTDPDYVAGWMAAFRAVYERYREHPGFEGYYLMQPCGESTVFDRPWNAQIAGYESTTQPAFREYLQKELMLSLEQLNARWGTAYTDWNQVTAPLPDFHLGKAPDLRRQWLDFNLFKVHLSEWWFRYAASQIREYDQQHLLVAYGGLDFAAPESLAKWVDYLHNGGNHFLHAEGRLIKAWDMNMGWITEPHHPYFWAAYGDPRDDGLGTSEGAGWVLDWSTYVMISQAGGGGANLHVYYSPDATNPLPAHYGGIAGYDRLEKFKPILRELHGVRLLETPRQAATLQDPYTLYCKHRTTFSPRLQDLGRWLELLKLDTVDAEDLREDHLGQYKLLVPNILDEVMSQKNIQTLQQAVGGGARMLISANTGKYCPDLGNEPFQLLRALGIQPPTGDFVINEKGVVAEVTEDNPLFDKGRRISFYSLADMQHDLDDPQVQKTFWVWPYRWLPQSDYFGYYKNNDQTNGKVLARFASGAVALSVHDVGRGQVIVFWGTPDYRPEALAGMMSRAADWAGIVNPRRGSPIPYLLEARNAELNRYYALMYQIHPGAYRLKLPQAPDGTWFVDDMVDSFKFGTYTGRELRETGLDLNFVKGASPLKIIRLIPEGQLTPDWTDFYRQPGR